MTEREAGSTFTVRLRQLRATAHPAGRGPYTNREIAAGCGMSITYVDNLFNGTQVNPSWSKLKALAEFFQVDPGYFFDAEVARRTDEELRQLLALSVALRNHHVQRFALRAPKVDPAVVAALVEMIERLPDVSGSGNEPES